VESLALTAQPVLERTLGIFGRALESNDHDHLGVLIEEAKNTYKGVIPRPSLPIFVWIAVVGEEPDGGYGVVYTSLFRGCAGDSFTV
jgi:hypothetical protein